MKLWRLWAVVAGYLIVMIAMMHSQRATTNVEWPVTAGDAGGMRYSPLKQINASNVNQLQVAWTYDVSDGAGTLETNPIVVNGVLYGYTPAQKVFAVNAATGQQLWQFDSGAPARGNNRGVAYWRSGSEERIFAGIRQDVYSLDAKTGQPDPKWGVGGRIDFRTDLRGGPEGTAGALGHPPVIYKDLVDFRRPHRREPACCARGHSRLRRADREASVDVPHHSTSG